MKERRKVQRNEREDERLWKENIEEYFGREGFKKGERKRDDMLSI